MAKEIERFKTAPSFEAGARQTTLVFRTGRLLRSERRLFRSLSDLPRIHFSNSSPERSPDSDGVKHSEAIQVDGERANSNVARIGGCRKISEAGADGRQVPFAGSRLAHLVSGAFQILAGGRVPEPPPRSIIILCESRHPSHFRRTSWTGLTGWTPTGPPSWSGLHLSILLAWNNPIGIARTSRLSPVTLVA